MPPPPPPPATVGHLRAETATTGGRPAEGPPSRLPIRVDESVAEHPAARRVLSPSQALHLAEHGPRAVAQDDTVRDKGVDGPAPDDTDRRGDTPSG